MAEPAGQVAQDEPSPTPGATPPAPGVGSPPAKPDEKPVEEPKPDAPPSEAQRLAEVAKAQQRLSSERMKFAHEMRKQREDFAKSQEEWKAKLAKADEYERIQADKRRNPGKYLAQDYGENWRDVIARVAIDGSATPDMLASELDEREARLKREMDAREEKLQKQFAEEREREATRAKQEYEASALAHIRGSADKYPLVHEFGVADNILGVIESHFVSTTRQDEDGNPIPGELLSPEQAAQKMEAFLAARLEAIQKKRSTPAPTPKGEVAAALSRTNPTPQRRTLSTDMTATTASEPAPPKDDGERMKRAIAAWERAQAARA